MISCKPLLGFLALTFLATTVTTSAFAAETIDPEKAYSPAYGRCMATGDAGRGVTPAMQICIGAEYERQDRLLNVAYKAAMAARSPAAQKALRQEQRGWIKRRDGECSENLTGGTIDLVEVPLCHLSMTAVRAIELKRMAKR
jgi:uncharacterized protein YecT (DUF1311 family)